MLNTSKFLCFHQMYNDKATILIILSNLSIDVFIGYIHFVFFVCKTFSVWNGKKQVDDIVM